MRASIIAASCFPLVLTGCTLTNTGTPSLVQGSTLSGSAYGGQQPIAGAHVYLFAANTTGYGGEGIAASSSNASVSLLNPTITGHSDSSGAYVLTDAGGNFSITGDYTCTPNTQVYAYALGGNAGAGTNSHAALLAALGNCPSAGNFLSNVSFIHMDEVTTVATAYAIAGFATDATHVSSSGSALAQTGIQNAFANAANLAVLSTGAAATTTAGGNGTPPTEEINTLANILAACINSNGAVTGPSTPSACYTLFANTTADGTSNGTQPTDTATAAINIAHNPGINVAALYGLAPAQSPFSPVLSSQPNDWTVSIQFAEGGDPSQGGVNDPYALAVDAYGNVWAANNGNAVGAVAELAPDGTLKSGATGFGDGTSAVFDGIAFDLNGDVWVPSYAANCLVKFSGVSGAVLSPPGGITGGGLSNPRSVTVDGSNNVWVSNLGVANFPFPNNVGAGASVYSVASSNWVSNTGYTGASLTAPYAIAADHTGNIWITNNSSNTVSELTPQISGAPLENSYTGIAGIGLPYGLAVDATGNIWIASSASFGTGNISELSSTGSAVSPFSGYGTSGNTGGIVNPQSIAIDGAGHAWSGDQSSETINSNTVSPIAEFDNNGNPISPNTGYVAPGLQTQTVALAIDGSGDIWAADPTTNYLVEFIGAAAPVVTPISTGVKNNTQGTRP